MMRYQLALPDGMRLTDLEDDAAAAATAAAARVRHAEGYGKAAVGPVAVAIRGRLEPCLRRLDDTARAFRVEAPQGLLWLELELAKAACAALPGDPAGEPWYSLHPRVAAAISGVIEPHVSRTPGETE